MSYYMDAEMLHYERRRKGLTVEGLCKLTEMSMSAFYRKCKGNSEFTIGEMHKIAEALELETPATIFFAREVS